MVFHPSKGPLRLLGWWGKGGSPVVGLQKRLGTFPAGGREVKGQLPVLKVAGGRPQVVPSSSPGSVSGGAGEGEVKGRVETAERSEVSLESSPAPGS